MIEGTDFYEYFSCPYKVYNRHNRDRKLMLPFSDFSKRLMEHGRDHEDEVVSSFPVHRPKYKFGDFKKGFEETHALMKQGVDYIYQGVLLHGEMLGIPDLLIKQKDGLYIPLDVKSSFRSKEEQIMQLMFYDYVLSKIQGKSEHTGILTLKSTSEIIDLTKQKERFDSAMQMIEKLSGGYDYGMHIDTVCKECPWRGVCVPIAEKTHDVSLIYGLSRPIHYKLLEKGIKTYEDMAEADPIMLEEIEGVASASIKKWKEQANVLITRKDKITPIKVPEGEHLCVDIESTEEGAVYLIGIWHKNQFRYFFSADDEKKMVEEFVDYVTAFDTYTLFHYGSIEKTTFRNMFEKYGVEENIAKDILNNMVDLLPLVRKHAVLPITYYNLKDVAKHFGFKWHASDASGGNSMVWVDEWLKTKNPELLKKLLQYNEDDVHATSIILEKLSGQ